MMKYEVIFKKEDGRKISIKEAERGEMEELRRNREEGSRKKK